METEIKPLCAISEVLTIHSVTPEGLLIRLNNGKNILVDEICFEREFIYEVK